MLWRKIFDFTVIFLLIILLTASWFILFKWKKEIASLNQEIETLNNQLEISNIEIKALKSLTDDINRWFDVSIVEAIIWNTRSWFEWWFQSIKSYLSELNKEAKIIKENQSIILTKIEKYENLLNWFNWKTDNIKRSIEEISQKYDWSNNKYYDLSSELRNLEQRIQTIEYKVK